jgi:hypothetical protein
MKRMMMMIGRRRVKLIVKQMGKRCGRALVLGHLLRP